MRKKEREKELECITHHRLSKQTSTVSDIIFSTRGEFSLVCRRRRRLMFEEFRFFTHRPRDIRWTKFIVNVKRVGFACSRGWRWCDTSFDRLISWNRFQQFIIASNRCWLILIDWFISKCILSMTRTTSSMREDQIVDRFHLHRCSQLKRTSIGMMNEGSTLIGDDRRGRFVLSEMFGTRGKIDLISCRC